MAIFRRDSPADQPSSPAPRPRPPRDVLKPAASSSKTYIAPGSRVVGEVGGSTEVLVDGELEGRVLVDNTVTIGRSGRVHGDIEGRVIRVEGKVDGDLRGHELIELMASASLEGNISAARVIISEGAYFKGGVEMTGGQGKNAEPAAAASTAERKPGQGGLYPEANAPAGSPVSGNPVSGSPEAGSRTAGSRASQSPQSGSTRKGR